MMDNDAFGLGLLSAIAVGMAGYVAMTWWMAISFYVKYGDLGMFFVAGTLTLATVVGVAVWFIRRRAA